MQVQCEGIRKSYGATHVLRGVDLKLDSGTVTALIGRNGAGKTTLIRILATMLRADGGRYLLGELDAGRQTGKARALVGYLGHESMLDGTLTVRENLRMFGNLYGVAEPARRADALVERFGAARFADFPVAELSRGQEQAAALCRALVHEPALLLLDEPSTALDTAAQERLWAMAREEAGRGAVVVFSTHDHDSARRVADRVLELADGRIA